MTIQNKFPTFMLASAMLLSSSLAFPATSSDDKPVKPDNTKVNERDKNPGAVTADQQKMNPKDRELTARIRKAVMADKTLSMNAHNVKIISQDGVVTLKGPVQSAVEVKTIMAKAVKMTGSAAKVSNQMSVQQ